MSKRRTHSPEFKARVAIEAISGLKTIQEIAADHAIHPIQVSQWKKQLLEGASDLFTRGKKTKDKEEGQAKGGNCSSRSADCRWSWSGKKVSAALMPVNGASWSITTIQSSASTGNVRC
jgi:transposase